MTSDAKTVAEYLRQLPEDRREALARVRRVILKNLPPGFQEGIDYGMITYSVPLRLVPDTYNGKPLMLAGLASRKLYMSLHLMSVYGDPATEAWFRKRFAASGKRLDMGKSCVRFRSADDLPLDLIGEAISRVTVDEFISRYARARTKHRASGKKQRKG